MTTPLPRRPIGNTGLELSILGFGGVQIGDYFVTMSEDAAQNAIESAYSAGVRYFDTAPRYGRGMSEHRMGHALRSRPRSEFVLSSKVGRNLLPDSIIADDPDRLGLPFKFDPDLSYDGTKKGVEQSLHRLGLSHIDIAYMHAIEPREFGDDYPERFREAVDGCYRALADLKAEGVIRAVGAAINEADASVNILRATELDVLMLAGRYTLAEQLTLHDVFPLAIKKNVAITIGAPFNSGVLASGVNERARYGNRPLVSEQAEKIQAIESACTEFNVPMAAAALQFPLAHPSVVSVIAGISSGSEASGNVDLIRHPIPADFWSALKQRHLLDDLAPVPGATTV